jgi:hypothetical protein
MLSEGGHAAAVHVTEVASGARTHSACRSESC